MDKTFYYYSRFIVTRAGYHSDSKTLVPLHEIEMESPLEDEDYEDSLKDTGYDRAERYYAMINGKRVELDGMLQNAVLDLKTKKLTLGIVVDIRDQTTRDGFFIDETVMLNSLYSERTGNHQTVEMDTIKDFVYNDYESSVVIINSEKDIQDYFAKHWTPEQIRTVRIGDVYEFRHWKPSFTMKSGRVVNSTYEMHHIKP